MKVDAKAAVGNVAKAIKELDRVRLEMSSLEKRDKKSKKKNRMKAKERKEDVKQPDKDIAEEKLVHKTKKKREAKKKREGKTDLKKKQKESSDAILVDQSPTEVKRKMKKQKTSCAEVPVDSSQRIEKKKKKLKKERKTTEGVDDGNGSLPNESPLNVKRKPRSQNPEQDPVTKSSKRKAEKSSDSLQNKSKRKTKKSKTEENGETKEPSNQKIEDLQSVDEVAAGSNSAKESLQSRRDETPAEDLSVEAQPTHKTEPNSESLPQQNFKKSSTQRAFRRVSNEDWIGKKNLYDNSYEATFGNSGWGAKAQKVLATVRGKSFRHEKTKKKRGTYFGGKISADAVNSIRFESDDD